MEFKRLLTIRAVDKKSRFAELDSGIDVDEKIVPRSKVPGSSLYLHHIVEVSNTKC